MPSSTLAERRVVEGLTAAIQRYLCPPTEVLLGIRQLTPACDVLPPAGIACPHCSAVRDLAKNVVPGTGIKAQDPLVCPACQCMNPAQERRARHHGKPVGRDEPAQSSPPPRLTAKQRKGLDRTPEGRAFLLELDAKAAGLFDLAHDLRALLHRLDTGAVLPAAFPARLATVVSKAASSPVVALWLAARDLEARGDKERSGRLLVAFYRARDGEIGLEELTRLTDDLAVLAAGAGAD